ncbi:hypothetical protein B0H19DRAFT_1264628 [Mycena capillaripes]|nr:hypothetical protein B0H19DRAFT_1264628 [Mycena capillaripes]
MSLAPQPIPTSLVAPIIEGYADGIRPAFAFILIPAIFGSMLVPLLILLISMSTAQARRKPIFVFNVISVSLGITAAGLSIHLTMESILRPFTPTVSAENLAFTVLGLWMSWFAEGILLIRVAIVYPRSRLPILLAFPIAAKIARMGTNIVLSIQWEKMNVHPASQLVVLAGVPRWLFKTSILLELFDNGYISSLFLWRLESQSHSRLFNASAIERISFDNSKYSYTRKIRTLFWIASINFIFPFIFGILQIIGIFTVKDIICVAILQMVTNYVVIICTVFATSQCPS